MVYERSSVFIVTPKTLLRFRLVRNRSIVVLVLRSDPKELDEFELSDDEMSDAEDGGDADDSNSAPDAATAFAAQLKGKYRVFSIRFCDMVERLSLKPGDDMDLAQLNFNKLKDMLQKDRLPMQNSWWFEWTSQGKDGIEYSFKVNSDLRLQRMIKTTKHRAGDVTDPKSVHYRLTFKKGPAPVETDSNWVVLNDV
ncbi:hypothetical protein KCU78_g11948, partial [Aureobasidium melanogenum]